MVQFLQGLATSLATDGLKALLIPALIFAWRMLYQFIKSGGVIKGIKTTIVFLRSVPTKTLIAFFVSPVVIFPFWIASIIWILPIIALIPPPAYDDNLYNLKQFFHSFFIFGITLAFVLWRISKRIQNDSDKLLSIYKILIDGIVIIATMLLFTVIFALIAVPLLIFDQLFSAIVIFSVCAISIYFVFWVGCIFASIGPVITTAATFVRLVKSQFVSRQNSQVSQPET